MTRTSAALAVSTTLFALLVAGCNGDDTATGEAAATSAPAASTVADQPGGVEVPDNIKAGTFVVSYRSAFPKLAEGRTDAEIADILTGTCADIEGGKSEDDTVNAIVDRTKSGDVAASKEEALAIFNIAKYIC